MTEWLYTCVLGLFFAHELDAIQRHEWRMFPVTNRMKDESGYAVFVVAHIPVLSLIVWFSFPPAGDSSPFRAGIAAFAVIHIALHWLYARHPANEFNNPLSQALIWGTGIAGACYLALRFMAFA